MPGVHQQQGEQMNQPITSSHHYDGAGNPAGGNTKGVGFNIVWQNGPLAIDGERKEPNGAFVEGIVLAAIDRMRFYQGEGKYASDTAGRFRCRQNALAITHLEEALHWLQDRTAERESRGVEGTHTV
jgi:hypothetical protein